MITNEEFQSKLEEILQQLQDLEQHPQWNAHCQQGLKTSDMNLADALEGISLAVDRGIPDAMGKNQKLLVEAIETEDFDLFTQEIQKYSSGELARLEKNGVLGGEFAYMLWSVCVTWGFEVNWAHLELETPEEILKIKEKHPDYDTEIPENFDSSIPLHQVRLWAPQDHMNRVK